MPGASTSGKSYLSQTRSRPKGSQRDILWWGQKEAKGTVYGGLAKQNGCDFRPNLKDSQISAIWCYVGNFVTVDMET